MPALENVRKRGIDVLLASRLLQANAGQTIEEGNIETRRNEEHARRCYLRMKVPLGGAQRSKSAHAPPSCTRRAR
jgi:hypothetical protein